MFSSQKHKVYAQKVIVHLILFLFFSLERQIHLEYLWVNYISFFQLSQLHFPRCEGFCVFPHYDNLAIPHNAGIWKIPHTEFFVLSTYWQDQFSTYRCSPIEFLSHIWSVMLLPLSGRQRFSEIFWLRKVAVSGARQNNNHESIFAVKRHQHLSDGPQLGNCCHGWIFSG